MACDPAGQYHSPYVYCGNNPLNTVDPDGRVGKTLTISLSHRSQIDYGKTLDKAPTLSAQSFSSAATVAIRNPASKNPVGLTVLTGLSMTVVGSKLLQYAGYLMANRKVPPANSIDPKTAEEAKKRFKERVDPKLQNVEGDKNRPPKVGGPKDPNDPNEKFPWWVPLLRILLQADKASPAETTHIEQEQQEQQEQQQNQPDEDEDEKLLNSDG